MGMLDFECKKTINIDCEQLVKKLVKQLQANGIACKNIDGNILLNKFNLLFATGFASIKVNDGLITLQGNVRPSLAGIICMILAIIFDCIGLFSECSIEEVLGLVWIIALGAAGTIGCIITFFVSVELLRQKLAALMNCIE